MSLRTVCRHVARLRDYGYVDTWREGPGGISAAVHIWRPGQAEAQDLGDEGPEGQGAEGVSDGGDSTPARQNLVRQTKSANSGVFTDEENKYAKVGRSFENEQDKVGRFTRDKSANFGRSFEKKAESGVPPLNNPPYKEFVKRVYKEPPTTTVVPINRGRNSPVAAVVEGNQAREGRRVSPASKALDKELSLIPGHERPITHQNPGTGFPGSFTPRHRACIRRGTPRTDHFDLAGQPSGLVGRAVGETRHCLAKPALQGAQ